MKLKSLLLKKRADILKRWLDVIFETYPPDTASFLKKQKNQFANPVGHTISEGIEGLFEQLLNEMEAEKVSTLLDNIIRIRAVQDFTPSKAIAFIPLLKKAIREDLKKEINESRISEELLEFELKIDDLSFLAFDIYMKCREKIYELKANESKNITYRLLQRANLICEIQEPGLSDSKIINIKKER